jgi:hypothetical protein
MKKPGLRRLRALGLLGTVAILVVLSLNGTSWAQVARAQTVPTLTFTPPPTLAASPRPTAILPTATPSAPPDSATTTPSPAAETPVDATASQPAAATSASTPGIPTPAASADLAACGAGPYVLAASVSIVPAQLVLSVGGLTLLALDGLDSQGVAPLAVSRFGAEVVPNDQLPEAPSGWRVLGCGLQATAASASGEIAGFLTKGLVACLTPPSVLTTDTPPRLAYFDPRPGIARWVFIPSHDTSGQLCSSRFHLPATFALLMIST